MIEYSENPKMRRRTSETAFKCKNCGELILYYKSKSGIVYPINAYYDSKNQVYVAKAFFGNHHNSTPMHKCQEVKNDN